MDERLTQNQIAMMECLLQLPDNSPVLTGDVRLALRSALAHIKILEADNRITEETAQALAKELGTFVEDAKREVEGLYWEISRLKKLVPVAHSEGYRDREAERNVECEPGKGIPLSTTSAWDISKAKRDLESNIGSDKPPAD